MNRKRLGTILILFGSVLALVVGVVVYIQAEQASEIAKRVPTAEAVVALTDLPERVAIPASAVAIVKVTAEVVPLEAATSLKDVVGKFPLTRIYKSEVIIQSKLADAAGKTGPSFTLKEGMVAFTLAGSDLLTTTGAIRPGDRVDVLLTLPLARVPTAGQPAPSIPMVTQTLVQNVEVLRVGPFGSSSDPVAAATAGKGITFQVDHQDALILKWAKDSGGVLDLALRHPTDREPVSTEAITANYVFRKFRFALAEGLQ